VFINIPIALFAIYFPAAAVDDERGLADGEFQKECQKGWPGELLAIIVLAARLLYSHSWPLSFVATAVA